VNFGFALSLILAGFSVVGVFIEIPFVSNYAFWIAIAAYVILAATHKWLCYYMTARGTAHLRLHERGMAADDFHILDVEAIAEGI
jgi:hypothetical protein